MPSVLNVLIDAMELRAADPQQRVIRKRFLSDEVIRLVSDDSLAGFAQWWSGAGRPPRLI